MIILTQNCRQITLLLIILVAHMAGCSTLPANKNIPAPHATDASETYLYQEAQQAAQQYPDQSGFFALADGIDALAARLALIEKAEASIDVQYYIWHDDTVGKIMHNRLLAAADRGVKIRILLDDLDTAGKDDLLALINYHPNINIRLFNPFPNRKARWLDFISSPARVNRRMHNKTLIVDQSFVVMGGRNIGDEYYNASLTVGFSDMDVIAVGPISKEVGQSFDLYWASDWSYPFASLVDTTGVTDNDFRRFRIMHEQYLSEAKKSPYGDAIKSQWQERFIALNHEGLTWGKWKLFYDQPSKVQAKEISKEQHIAPHLLSIMDQVEHDLIIVSPYFVPGEEFTAYLTDKVQSGVRVRILTNSLAANDVKMVHAGYRRYREDLIKGGVELYEFKPTVIKSEQPKKHRWTGSSRASLHGKYLGFDKHWVFVGSFNLDGRSVKLNTEIAVLFESERYGTILTENFDQFSLTRGYAVTLDEDENLQWKTLEDNEIVRYDHEPKTSAWSRFWNRVMSLVVPESQL